MQRWESKRQKNTRGLYNWDMGGILSGGSMERVLMGWNLSLRSLRLRQKRRELHSSPKRWYLGSFPHLFLQNPPATPLLQSKGVLILMPPECILLMTSQALSPSHMVFKHNHLPQRCSHQPWFLVVDLNWYLFYRIHTKYPDLKTLKYKRNTLCFPSTSSGLWRHIITISGLVHLNWAVLALLAKTMKWFSACLNLMIFWL